jgi:hypothetical protein
VKALSLTSESQYGQALHYLQLVEKHLPANEGERYRFYRQLLKGYVLGGLGRRDEALKTLSEFQRDVTALGYETDELKYLRCYAASVGNDILKSSGAGQPPFSIDHAGFDLSKVPSHVRRHFPLRYHPRWRNV